MKMEVRGCKRYTAHEREQFKENLKLIRQIRGMTQSEVAEKLGVERTVLCRYESGKYMPGEERIEELADIYEVDRSVLFTDRGFEQVLKK